VAYLQLKQLSLVEKTSGASVNQPVVNYSTAYVEKLTSAVVPKVTKGKCQNNQVVKYFILTGETCVTHCGPYLWLSISRTKNVSIESTAKDIMLDMKSIN